MVGLGLVSAIHQLMSLTISEDSADSHAVNPTNTTCLSFFITCLFFLHQCSVMSPGPMLNMVHYIILFLFHILHSDSVTQGASRQPVHIRMSSRAQQTGCHNHLQRARGFAQPPGQRCPAGTCCSAIWNAFHAMWNPVPHGPPIRLRQPDAPCERD